MLKEFFNTPESQRLRHVYDTSNCFVEINDYASMLFDFRGDEDVFMPGDFTLARKSTNRSYSSTTNYGSVERSSRSNFQIKNKFIRSVTKTMGNLRAQFASEEVSVWKIIDGRIEDMKKRYIKRY